MNCKANPSHHILGSINTSHTPLTDECFVLNITKMPLSHPTQLTIFPYVMRSLCCVFPSCLKNVFTLDLFESDPNSRSTHCFWLIS